MAYKQDLADAARRHFRSATYLYQVSSAGAQPGCRVVAGYIFGLAGELALKQMMRKEGFREMPLDQRRDDPFYAHFPELKSLLAHQLKIRRNTRLISYATSGSLFSNWSTKMRYAPTIDVQDSWVDAWKKSAEQLLNEMDAL